MRCTKRVLDILHRQLSPGTCHEQIGHTHHIRIILAVADAVLTRVGVVARVKLPCKPNLLKLPKVEVSISEIVPVPCLWWPVARWNRRYGKIVTVNCWEVLY